MKPQLVEGEVGSHVRRPVRAADPVVEVLEVLEAEGEVGSGLEGAVAEPPGAASGGAVDPAAVGHGDHVVIAGADGGAGAQVDVLAGLGAAIELGGKAVRAEVVVHIQ